MTTDWMADASCREMGRTWDLLGVQEQVALCSGCPVVDPCREHGLKQKPVAAAAIVTHGGLTPTQLCDETTARRLHGRRAA